MDPVVTIGERVDVGVWYRGTGEVAFPVKMVRGGREVVFRKLGMRHETSVGRRMVHVFDMSDGVNDYRLEFDAVRLTWTLVSMIPGEA